MYTFLKKSILTSTVSLFLGSFVLSSPSQAASVNFTDSRGDVTTSGSQTSLTNAFDGSDDASVNYNVSGNTPVSADNLESFLGVTPGSLGGNPTEGSAVKTTLAASAGDVFSFDWVFRTNEPVNSIFPDYAFVTIGSQVFNLADITNATIPGSTLGSNPNLYLRQTNNNTFSYTFNTAGTYNVGIGVVDVNDFTVSSALSLRDANTQPVPEPLTILGSAMAAGFGVMLKRKQALGNRE